MTNLAKEISNELTSQTARSEAYSGAITEIGLVGAVRGHCFHIGHMHERGLLHRFLHLRLDSHSLPDVKHKAFNLIHDSSFISKRHFNIQLPAVSDGSKMMHVSSSHLCELRLAIRPQIFVTETPSELKVFWDPGCHQYLFVLLRALRQCICEALFACWDQELACALWR